MLVVPELDDPFLPLPDDLLVNLSESREVVEALLDALPAGYNSSTSNDCAMGPALQVWLPKEEADQQTVVWKAAGMLLPSYLLYQETAREQPTKRQTSTPLNLVDVTVCRHHTWL